MTEIDHWHALFDKKYLRWFDLQGREIEVEIEKVERKKELTLPGGAKAKKSLLHFKGASKPLVLNPTNAQAISRIHGEQPSQWVGKSIVLYQAETKMGGDMVPCIRVKQSK